MGVILLPEEGGGPKKKKTLSDSDWKISYLYKYCKLTDPRGSIISSRINTKTTILRHIIVKWLKTRVRGKKNFKAVRKKYFITDEQKMIADFLLEISIIYYRT